MNNLMEDNMEPDHKTLPPNPPLSIEQQFSLDELILLIERAKSAGISEFILGSLKFSFHQPYIATQHNGFAFGKDSLI